MCVFVHTLLKCTISGETTMRHYHYQKQFLKLFCILSSCFSKNLVVLSYIVANPICMYMLLLFSASLVRWQIHIQKHKQQICQKIRDTQPFTQTQLCDIWGVVFVRTMEGDLSGNICLSPNPPYPPPLTG